MPHCAGSAAAVYVRLPSASGGLTGRAECHSVRMSGWQVRRRRNIGEPLRLPVPVSQPGGSGGPPLITNTSTTQGYGCSATVH